MLKIRFIFLLLVLVHSAAEAAPQWGRIEGVIRTSDGQILGGVTVLLLDEQRTIDATVTGDDGRFGLEHIQAGSYDIWFVLGSRESVKPGLEVNPGKTAILDHVADWKDVSFAETITVLSASRRRERILDAPATVNTVSETEIELVAATGQVPRLLEFTPGVQVTQSGVYDYNLNTRGFNRPLTRRVQTLIDGREIATPFAASQEWLVTSSLAIDLASVEFLRGPSAALHGPNTFNGVLNLTTKAPRNSQGGKVQIAAGELSTQRIDLRWAGELSSDWYGKFQAGYGENDDFARSRNQTVEYQGLMPEGVSIPNDENESFTASLRFDHYLTESQVLTLEAGGFDGGGVVLVTPGGRTLCPVLERAWLRANYNTPRWNARAYHNQRKSDDGINLATGGLIDLDSDKTYFEVQGNKSFERSRWVGGLSLGRETIDSADEAGVQTILSQAVDMETQAAFAQFDTTPTDKIKLVLALRWDDSSLHDSQLSPKAGVVYSPSPDKTFRLTYNEAFQWSNYGEQFIRFDAGAIDLSFFEFLLAPVLGGVGLGLAEVPFRILGNPALEVEKIRGFEFGYTAILRSTVLLSVNLYSNRMEDFITDVLPGVNPSFPAYLAPVSLPPAAAAVIEATLNSAVPGLTNDPDGSAALVLSLGNTGKVDSQGGEFSLSWMPSRPWKVDLSYAYFDFEVKDAISGVTIPANHPENAFSLGLSYAAGRSRVLAQYRWSDDFSWESGVHVGPVPSYGVVNLDSSFQISERLEIGLNIANLFDDNHHEIFGGDLLGRRALGHLTITW